VEPLKVPERIDAISKTASPPAAGSAEAKAIARAALLRIERFMTSLRSEGLRNPFHDITGFPKV
jgi:hypothetical protein